MYSSEGILTARGGMTSHCAVVARGMGTCCVAGCSEAPFPRGQDAEVCLRQVLQGRRLAFLDGSPYVYGEALPTAEAQVSGNFATIMQWADEVRTLHVRTNADTRRREVAAKFGAEGIGLCRTEHMFFDESRIPAMREMIVSKDEASAAVRSASCFRCSAATLRASIRRWVAARSHPLPGSAAARVPADRGGGHPRPRAGDGSDLRRLLHTVENLHEFNRCWATAAAVLRSPTGDCGMQTRAVIEAAIETRQETGFEVVPEIMIPLVARPRNWSL
jgi:pyruvate,orthophosphate dikinase